MVTPACPAQIGTCEPSGEILNSSRKREALPAAGGIYVHYDFYSEIFPLGRQTQSRDLTDHNSRSNRGGAESAPQWKRRVFYSWKIWCGRWELNPHGPCSPADFLTGYGFRRPDMAGLRSGLSLHLTPEVGRLGAARLVSTPSCNSGCCCKLGSGSPVKVSPTLSSSASPVSRRALKVF